MIFVFRTIPNQPFMYYVLNKDIIESEIICHLPVRKRGCISQVPLSEIINCSLCKLKIGNHVVEFNDIYPSIVYTALLSFTTKLYLDVIVDSVRKVFGEY